MNALDALTKKTMSRQCCKIENRDNSQMIQLTLEIKT